jgi:O-acetyl-ADP-ribose deacetylase (regulator of RNase III)
LAESDMLTATNERRTLDTSRLRLIRADITTLDVEAIVFYTRPDLALGSGFGNAIARRGGPSIKKELDQIGGIEVTDAVVTTAGNMKAKHIIHAAGPAFQEAGLEEKLRATVFNALKRAEERGIKQIALPPMGTGFYGISLSVCSEVMINTITEYLSNNTGLLEVLICANDMREYKPFETRLALLSHASR